MSKSKKVLVVEDEKPMPDVAAAYKKFRESIESLRPRVTIESSLYYASRSLDRPLTKGNPNRGRKFLRRKKYE